MKINESAKSYAMTLLGISIMAAGLWFIPDKPLIKASYLELAVMFLVSMGFLPILYGWSIAIRKGIIGPILMGTAISAAIVIARDDSAGRLAWVAAAIAIVTAITWAYESHTKRS